MGVSLLFEGVPMSVLFDGVPMSVCLRGCPCACCLRGACVPAIFFIFFLGGGARVPVI